mgnify:CR=1 FL=1
MTAMMQGGCLQFGRHGLRYCPLLWVLLLIEHRSKTDRPSQDLVSSRSLKMAEENSGTLRALTLLASANNLKMAAHFF